MVTQDTCCTIVPYFEVKDENMASFRELCDMFVEMASTEPKCLYYGFSFNGNTVHCREGYEDADGVLAHLKNVGQKLGEVLEISDMVKIEIHGAEAELAKLRGPLADLNAEFFTLECGFRR